MYTTIPMVPGPVTVPDFILQAMYRDFPSGQVDSGYLNLVRSCEQMLRRLLQTRSRIYFLSGEGMLGLWAGLRSVLRPDSKVLVVSCGFFGDGIASMAESIGSTVNRLSFGYDATVGHEELVQIEAALQKEHFDLICAVHCETPSGTLNPLSGIGELKEKYGVPLFYADIVSSIGGTPIFLDQWKIDIALAGSQKCLSLPPSLSIVAVSKSALRRIREVKYQGYDALLPFEDIYEMGRCPYTPDWHILAGLFASLDAMEKEGLDAVYLRHERCADMARTGLLKLGIPLWPGARAVQSPTVTCALIPEGWDWGGWRKALSELGLVVAGSFGPMQGKTFRLGHMGSQANQHLVARALDVIEEVLGRRQLRMV